MLHELDDTTSLWLQDPVKNWRDWPVTQDKASSDDAVEASGLLTKVNEDKLARDVDDLSAIFEELADGVIDFPLPGDDDDEFIAAPTATNDDVTDAAADEELVGGAVGAWLDNLDSDDAMNVDAISEAFDALVAEQEQAMHAAAVETTSYSTSEYDDDEDMDESDYETDDDDSAVAVQVVPAAPVWAVMAPLDPRSCIKTAVFQNLDARIPRIAMPRIDLAFGSKPDAVAATRPVSPIGLCVSPKRASDNEKAAAAATTPVYRHDPTTCWICKSAKTPEKKRALHRFLEKRSRRNWKKGPRYSGRSNVAASRVRNGGRFICTTQWI